MRPIIIGIAGGTASGKTTIANRLVESFLDETHVTVIRQDDYYKDQTHKTMTERVKNNYDHPDAFDTEFLVEQLSALKRGETILKPTYDYELHTRSDIVEMIAPSRVIVLEGIFVLAQKEVRDLCDIKVYCDTPDDIRFIRRLVRDVNERGRTVESVINQYLSTVKPMHDAFIEPSKKYANIIFPENTENDVAIDLLITKIASIIQ